MWNVKYLMFNMRELYFIQIKPDCYKLSIHLAEFQLINMINYDETTLTMRTEVCAVHTA